MKGTGPLDRFVAPIYHKFAAGTHASFRTNGDNAMKQQGLPPFLLIFILLTAMPAWSQDSDVVASDFDGSGKVDFADFLLFAGGFGKKSQEEGYEARFDLSGNSEVDFADFLIFAGNFSKSTTDEEPDLVAGPVYLYVADLFKNAVEAYDTSTNLLDPSRSLAVTEPRGIAFSSTNKEIYVAAWDSFHAFTELGARAFDVTFDPAFEPGGASQRAGGFKAALSTDHQFAFVTESEIGVIDVIDIPNKVSTARILVAPGPRGIAASPDGQKVYVAHGASADFLSVIDAVQHTLVDSITVEPDIRPTRMAIAQDGSKIYLNNTISRRLAAIDPVSKSVVDSVTVGLSTDQDPQILDLGLSKDGSRLYATYSRLDPINGPDPFPFIGSLIVVDTATFSIVGEIALGTSAASLGISPDGKTGYVSGADNIDEQFSFNLRVFIIDLESQTKLGALLGFSLPVELRFNASKPALPWSMMPDLTVF